MGLPQLAGAAGFVLAAPAIAGWYHSLTFPAGTPPDWVFGPVWTALYVLMGAAAWLVWYTVHPSGPLRMWGWQLLLNAIWGPVFFGLHAPLAGLVVILPVLATAAATTFLFWRARTLAGLLMLPYVVWLCYATWINIGFVRLNPSG